jgi:hypothetical protein
MGDSARVAAGTIVILSWDCLANSGREWPPCRGLRSGLG